MRVDAAYDVRHRRQDHDVASSERGLHVRQDKRLRFHAARIPDDRNDRRTEKTLGRNRRLRQLIFMRIPTASRIIRGAGQPWRHRRLRHCSLYHAKNERGDKIKTPVIHLCSLKNVAISSFGLVSRVGWFWVPWEPRRYRRVPERDRPQSSCERITQVYGPSPMLPPHGISSAALPGVASMSKLG